MFNTPEKDCLWEASVFYTFDKHVAKKMNFKNFIYETFHNGNFVVFDNVYTHNEKDAKKLIEHWSRTPEWKYFFVKEVNHERH